MRVSYITMNRMMEDQLAQDPGLRKSLEPRGRGVLSDGRAMSDSQLLPHLHSSNVELDRPQFEQLAGRYLSAEEMSRALLKKSSRELGGNPSRRGRNRWRQIAASARRAKCSLPIFHLNSPTFSQENLTAADAVAEKTWHSVNAVNRIQTAPFGVIAVTSFSSKT